MAVSKAMVALWGYVRQTAQDLCTLRHQESARPNSIMGRLINVNVIMCVTSTANGREWWIARLRPSA